MANYSTTTESSTPSMDVTQRTEEQRDRLQKLIKERREPLNPGPGQIRYITENTVRVVYGTSKENEFVFQDGKPYPKEAPYHIHYTKDLEEYFMSGVEHDKNSKIILKVDEQTEFAAYQRLKNVKPNIIKESQIKPSPKDLKVGYMKRYFAKKPNDGSAPFEIAKRDMDKSPLYIYTTVVWHFAGRKSDVNGINSMALDLAEKRMPGIRNVIPNLQYFVESNLQSPKEIVMSKISKIVGTTQTTEEQTTSSSQTQTQQSPAPSGYNAGSGGPPPGVMTGGAGGGSY